MAIRVTKPVTKYGRVYRQGEIIDDPSSTERSLARLFAWETVPDSPPSLRSLRKADLVQLAEDRELDVEGLSKAEIVEVLEA